MAASLGLRIVDEVDVRIYNIDWSAWLAGAAISSSSWTVPASLTDVVESSNTTRTSIKLTGWHTGSAYTIYNTITTSDGRTRRISFDLECK